MASIGQTVPRVGDVRAAMPSQVRQRSVAQALLLFAPIAILYLASVLGAVVLPYWPVKLVFSGAAAFFMSLLFVIGHDACHGAYTPYRWLNGFLGRLAFAPSLHPYSGWEHTHNHVHHGYTNLRSMDYVWSPLSKDEYDGLSAFGRWKVRCYRSLLGFGPYYFARTYLPHILFAFAEHYRRSLLRFTADFLLVVGFAAGQTAAILAVSRALEMENGWAEQLFFAQVLPLVIFHYLIGFLIYLHHTHPRIPWFKDETEWNFYRGQVQGTVHVKFPGPINWILCHIMEHTAHHADPKIPLYHLGEAQKSLEAAFREDIVEHKFSFRSLFYSLRVCQLYDFQQHCWVNWAGEQTSSRTLRTASAAPSALADESAAAGAMR